MKSIKARWGKQESDCNCYQMLTGDQPLACSGKAGMYTDFVFIVMVIVDLPGNDA